MDLTNGRRVGYHWFTEYGNIFMENRYTDWGNYYPYKTLRNIWQLSPKMIKKLNLDKIKKNLQAGGKIYCSSRRFFRSLQKVVMI